MWSNGEMEIPLVWVWLQAKLSNGIFLILLWWSDDDDEDAWVSAAQPEALFTDRFHDIAATKTLFYATFVYTELSKGVITLPCCVILDSSLAFQNENPDG